MSDVMVHADFDSDYGPDGDGVVRLVAAARRRLRATRMTRLAAVTAPAGVAAGTALVPVAGVPLWSAAALGVLGGVIGAAWAAWHTPPVTHVARVLDSHLGLRDRVSAALQLRGTGGPIAALVARDAATRLAPVDLRALFPFAIGRAPVAAGALAIALLAWLPGTGSGGRPPSTPAASAARDAEAGPAGPARRAGSPSSSRGARPRPSGDEPPVRTRDPERPRTARDARGGVATPDSPPPSPATAASSALAHTRDAGAATSGAATTPAAADGAVTRRTATSAPGRSASGTTSSGAGGAAPGNALASAAAGGTVPVSSAAAIIAARGKAEAALARDVIPPDYRDHVRAYFQTLGEAAP